jgi:heat shock protein HtpX
MKIAKRVFLFVTVNILIVVTLSVVLSLLGVEPYLTSKGLSLPSLMIFCVLWGFGGAFISLLISRMMAKWMMGVRVVASDEPNPQLRELVGRVHDLSRRAGLSVMPEVGVYESPELNAFATGPTKRRSLVAVSTGLLERMDARETEGVLAHEVAHIANGDMVTMTLVQGVVNSFVMFLARVIGFFASQFVDEEKRPLVQFGIVLGLEVLLGAFGMAVVAAFSRAREYRADAGGALLGGPTSMIAALEALKRNYEPEIAEASGGRGESALASLKISGKSSGFARFFATHPALDDRIARLKSSAAQPDLIIQTNL